LGDVFEQTEQVVEEREQVRHFGSQATHTPLLLKVPLGQAM
jgi:hypothetical protein